MSDLQLKILASSDIWHVDGTFYTSPKGYIQVFNIHAWYKNEMFYTGCILLEDKEALSYEIAFKKIIECAPVQLAPKVKLNKLNEN